MHQQMLMAVASGGTVSHVASSGAGYVNGATTINSPLTPAGIANGDGLYAIVYARSALTPPSGWTLVASQVNTGTLTQTLYVYRKNTVSTSDGAAAFTWTQAVSGRMGLAYVVARSTSGAINQAQTSSAETDITTPGMSFTVTIPALTAAANGELFIIAATAEAGSVSPLNDTWTAPTGSTMRTTNTIPENRLAAFTQARNAGQSNAATAGFAIGAGGGSTANYFSAITIRLSA
jgi:hypothetical protein